MIDWHCHVLPMMDDGSRNVAESISIIEMLASQGVKTVVATPHFYANDESVQAFLERRSKSFKELNANLPENSPKILLGAEVRYYEGISRLADIKALRIEGSKLLLLEMPMAVWTESMVRELTELSANTSIQIVLAHIERYLGLQKQAVWERIYESGILTQVNTGFFTAFLSKRKAISLMKDGKIHFVGTDSHNTTSRAPQLDKAFDIIRNKLGDNYICQMNEYGYSVLGLRH